jgi:hypothetical protein
MKKKTYFSLEFFHVQSLQLLCLQAVQSLIIIIIITTFAILCKLQVKGSYLVDESRRSVLDGFKPLVEAAGGHESL